MNDGASCEMKDVGFETQSGELLSTCVVLSSLFKLWNGKSMQRLEFRGKKDGMTWMRLADLIATSRKTMDTWCMFNRNRSVNSVQEGESLGV